MKSRMTVLLCMVPLLASCNGVKEFGNARVTADYFFRNYTDFYSVNETDYVEVGIANDDVKPGEYISAISGKFGMSYRFYELEEKVPGLLLVNSYSKLRRINKYEIYASKEAKTVPISYLKNFPGKYEDGSEADKIILNDKTYAAFGSTYQPITGGDLVGSYEDKNYNELPDHPNWVYTHYQKKKEEITVFYYDLENISELDVEIVWLIHDQVIHE